LANNHLNSQTTYQRTMAGWDAPATRVYNWDIPAQEPDDEMWAHVQNVYGWDEHNVPINAPIMGLTEDEIDELTALIGNDAANNLIQRININGPDRIAALDEISAIFEDAYAEDLDETDETDDDDDETDDEDEEPQFYFPNQPLIPDQPPNHLLGLIPDQNGIPHCVYNAPGEPDDIMWIFDNIIIRKRGDIYTQERTQN